MWMDREIQKADFVALVCTETYLRRVEGREEPGKGRGVLWEGRLIYNHLYTADAGVQRFVPILLEDGAPSSIPWPLRGLAFYQVDGAEGYEDFFRHITGQRRQEKPELGKTQGTASDGAAKLPSFAGSPYRAKDPHESGPAQSSPNAEARSPGLD